MTTHHTDKILVQRILSGEQQAFTALVGATQVLVAQIVYKMVANGEERKDLAQDIYIKVYRHLPSFRFQSKLSTWVAQVAYNTCYDHLRKKNIVVYLDSFPEEQEVTAMIQEEPALQKDRQRIIKEEMQKLSPIYQTLVTLYHQEEMSYEEICQVTGLPEGTVKNYLFRARRLLRQQLLKNYQKEEL